MDVGGNGHMGYLIKTLGATKTDVTFNRLPKVIQVAREEEAIGVAAGAYFAGERHILLMQNHGFLAAMNGIVSLAML